MLTLVLTVFTTPKVLIKKLEKNFGKPVFYKVLVLLLSSLRQL